MALKIFASNNLASFLLFHSFSLSFYFHLSFSSAGASTQQGAVQGRPAAECAALQSVANCGRRSKLKETAQTGRMYLRPRLNSHSPCSLLTTQTQQQRYDGDARNGKKRKETEQRKDAGRRHSEQWTSPCSACTVWQWFILRRLSQAQSSHAQSRTKPRRISIVWSGTV